MSITSVGTCLAIFPRWPCCQSSQCGKVCQCRRLHLRRQSTICPLTKRRRPISRSAAAEPIKKRALIIRPSQLTSLRLSSFCSCITPSLLLYFTISFNSPFNSLFYYHYYYLPWQSIKTLLFLCFVQSTQKLLFICNTSLLALLLILLFYCKNM